MNSQVKTSRVKNKRSIEEAKKEIAKLLIQQMRT